MDTLVNYGSGIKSVEETADGWKIGGYLVVFGSHDASHLKDRFSAETDFDIEDGERTSIYYNHGLDGTIKRTKLGNGRLFIKDAGVWFEGELKKRGDFLQEHVAKIAEAMTKSIEIKGVSYPAFGLSSGAPAHLVEREPVKDGHLVTKWPLRTDCSITPTPAEPLTACNAIKSLDEVTAEVMAVPDSASSTSAFPATVAPNLRDEVKAVLVEVLTEHRIIKPAGAEPAAPPEAQASGTTNTPSQEEQSSLSDEEQQRMNSAYVKSMIGDPALLEALNITA